MRSLMGLLLLLLLLLSLLMLMLLLLLLLLLLKDDVVLGRRLNSFGRSGLRDEFLSGTDVPGPGFAECYETDFDVGIDLREIHEDKSETDREVDMGTDKNENDTASLFQEMRVSFKIAHLHESVVNFSLWTLEKSFGLRDHGNRAVRV